MTAYGKGARDASIIILAVLSVAGVVVYAKRVDIILALLKRERAALAKDPLGRLANYLPE